MQFFSGFNKKPLKFKYKEYVGEGTNLEVEKTINCLF